jgi:hypothetical protein
MIKTHNEKQAGTIVDWLKLNNPWSRISARTQKGLFKWGMPQQKNPPTWDSLMGWLKTN